MESEVEVLATKTVESGEPEKVPRFLEEISDKTHAASDEVLEENSVEPCDVKNEPSEVCSEETVGVTDKTDTEPVKDCNPRMAALMAVHLVSEVLDEAYLIANGAQESGQPWKYLSKGNNAHENNIDESSGPQLEESKGDNVNENNIDDSSGPHLEESKGDNVNENNNNESSGLLLEEFNDDYMNENNRGESFESQLEESKGENVNEKNLDESSGPLLEESNGVNVNENNKDQSSGPQLEESKGDNVNENNFETAANIIATSTPQKNVTHEIDCSDDTLTPSFNDSTLIGQGDEEIETQENDTSMYINQLFNMSDVERVIFCGTDDSNLVQNISEPNDLLNEAMNKIMDSYVANPFQSIEEYPAVMSSFIANPFHHLEQYTDEQYEDLNENTPTEMLSSDYSEYSFLSDAYVADIGRDVTFYIEEGPAIKKEEVYESLRSDLAEGTTEFQIAVNDTVENRKTVIEQEKHNDFQLYENAYVTLNRDYDQCSEDDGYPILQDPKEMILQEVELMTSNTSDDEKHIPKATVSKKEEPDVSTLNGSRRSTLARRCRYQGAKLFACLRGWWRRKIPGNRKESKRAVLPVCPLSPDARRRASSLLDNRLLRSPSPTRPLVWKFNTVNEVIVNSNRWKDYTFSAMPEERRADNI